MEQIYLIQSNNTSLKQNQQLLVNLAMKQAFHVLQLPTVELGEWLEREIESNPVLEIDLSRESFKERLTPLSRNKAQENLERERKEYQDSRLRASLSLYEHLMQQIPLVLEEKQDLNLAEWIIGHLNEKGFLETSLQEIAPSVPLERLQRVLSVIQMLDPPGVGAEDLRGSLLLQLRLQKKQNGIAVQIVERHFEDLMQNRLPSISKALHISLVKLTQVIESEIAPLDLYPGYRFLRQPVIGIIPDLLLLSIEGRWQVEVNTSFLPRFHIVPLYREAIQKQELDVEERAYVRKNIAAGTWLKRIVHKRNETLRQIGGFILKRQFDFFNAETDTLTPLKMQEAADELGVHESTIARAVANKYLACPRGIFLLKSFFNQGIAQEGGSKISNQSLKEILTQMVETEDKQEPLSDEEMALRLRKRGILCARRTVAKYRSSLQISSAAKRKKWVQK